MATSELGYYARFGATAIDSLDPVDSGMAQRALGNLNHLADQAAQVRIKWARPAGSGALSTAEDVAETGGYQRLWTSTPFDLHLRPTSESYRLRLRWRLAASITGVGSGDSAWRFVLGPVGASADDLLVTAPNVATHALGTTSAAWVTHGTLLYLDAAHVRRCAESVRVVDSIGGETVTARWLRVESSVWAHVDSTADDVASLSGVELAEYYAP